MQRSLTDIPRNHELDKFHRMLEWIIAWHEQNEPWASRVIESARALEEEIPYNTEDFAAE